MPLKSKSQSELLVTGGANPGRESVSTRERIYARLVKNAESVDRFLGWVDSLYIEPDKRELSEDQIVSGLTAHTADILNQLPPAALAKARTFIQINSESQQILATSLDRTTHNGQDEDWVFDVFSEEENEQLDSLDMQLSELDVDNDPDVLLAISIEAWTKAVQVAWREVRAYQYQPEAALADLNQYLVANGDNPLDLTTTQITFTPLCVVFTIPTSAKIKARVENFGGLYFPKTPFVLIKQHRSAGTVAHELGHRLFDLTEDRSRDLITTRLLRLVTDLKTYSVDPDKQGLPEAMKQSYRDRLKTELRHGMIDWLREEIIAEANRKRAPVLGDFSAQTTRAQFNELFDDPTSWRTAEIDALQTLPEFIVHELLPRLASLNEQQLVEIATLATVTMRRRFMRIKRVLNECFDLARYLPDSEASRFVAALITVTPVRLMHRLFEVLQAKYGVEAVTEARRLSESDD